jgi:hypothetical protein
VTPVPEKSIPEQVRAACAWVAEQADSVCIDEARIEGYASGLPDVEPGPAPGASDREPDADRETRAAFAISLNAINFGSGWWPTIEKRPGLSGFATIEAGLADRFRDYGPWSAAELTRLAPADLATALGQNPEHPLMAQFAASLSDVGAHLVADHGGSFTAAVDSAQGSAPALAGLFAGWQSFADTSLYMERQVPFFKRAQLATADVARAAVADLRDLDRLTAFADNLVPHVLRLDAVLVLDPALQARIESGDLLVHESPEEVELRACAVDAVELLAAARPDLTAAEIDSTL